MQAGVKQFLNIAIVLLLVLWFISAMAGVGGFLNFHLR
jgi:hypothetical protein